ncbi:hypothetical protein ACFL35_10500 [Candidatus Riflebacteria bacterium]
MIDFKFSYITSLFILFLVTNCYAGNEPQGVLKLKTSRVIIFKDGHCLIEKKCNGILDERLQLFTEDVPKNAILGTFWFSDDRNEIQSMVAEKVEKKTLEKKEEDCLNYFELLQENVGQELQVEFTHGKSLKGKLLAVLKKEETAKEKNTRDIFTHRNRYYSSYVPLREAVRDSTILVSKSSGDMFILADENSQHVFTTGQIRTISGKNLKRKTLRKKQKIEKTKRLLFQFKKEQKMGSKKSFSFFYFSPGIRWIPSYRLDLKGKETADISLQAVILNENEDLKEAEAFLVVGIPSFEFKKVPSPFTLEKRLTLALEDAAPRLMRQDIAPFYNVRRSSEHSIAPHTSSIELQKAANSLSGDRVGELYYYSVGKINLAKGARMAVPIFSASIPSKEKYHWDIHLVKTGGKTTGSQAEKKSPALTNLVWQQAILQNRIKQPWTTGSVFCMANGKPMGQNTLRYTSSGKQVVVPITAAVDIHGEIQSREKSRKINAIRFHGYMYSKIEEEAKLIIKNFKKEKADIRVECRFGGKCFKTSDNGRIILASYNSNDWKNPYGDISINNSSVVRWDLNLAAGEEKVLTIDFLYFLRN